MLDLKKLDDWRRKKPEAAGKISIGRAIERSRKTIEAYFELGYDASAIAEIANRETGSSEWTGELIEAARKGWATKNKTHKKAQKTTKPKPKQDAPATEKNDQLTDKQPANNPTPAPYQFTEAEIYEVHPNQREVIFDDRKKLRRWPENSMLALIPQLGSRPVVLSNVSDHKFRVDVGFKANYDYVDKAV